MQTLVVTLLQGSKQKSFFFGVFSFSKENLKVPLVFRCLFLFLSKMLSTSELLLFLHRQRQKRIQFLNHVYLWYQKIIQKELKKTLKFSSIVLQRYLRNGYGVPRRRKKGLKRRSPTIQKPGSISLDSFKKSSLFSLTGIDNDDFEEIFTAIEPMMNRGKGILKSRSILTNPTRLVAVFYYLRHAPSRKSLSLTFHVHWKTLWADRKFLLPLIWKYLRSTSRIGWVSSPEKTSFTWNQACAAIDCTSHFRDRVHPGHSFYYRGDKGGTFLTVQLVIDLAGSKIFGFDILRGHNNDQGNNIFFCIFFNCVFFFRYPSPYSICK